jgi:hypothetical protein
MAGRDEDKDRARDSSEDENKDRGENIGKNIYSSKMNKWLCKEKRKRDRIVGG